MESKLEEEEFIVRKESVRINNCDVRTVMCGERCFFSYAFIFPLKSKDLRDHQRNSERNSEAAQKPNQ